MSSRQSDEPPQRLSKNQRRINTILQRIPGTREQLIVAMEGDPAVFLKARMHRPGRTYRKRYSVQMEEIKSLIRHARLEANLTQAELAERAGTSQPAVARYEQGSVEPSMSTFERLLAACGRRAIVSTVPASDATLAQSSHSGPDMRLLRNGRSALLTAAAECGARDVRLFGSVARGEQHRGSDVDLLVELEPGRTLLDLAAFRRRAGDILGVPVDVATPDMLKVHIRSEALAQAQPL
jgi:uncharacterized protein